MSAGSPKTPRILIVEDDPIARKVYIDFFRAKGFTAVVARDGEEALSKFDEQPPDVVLLDAAIPKIDGFEVLYRIRSDPKGRSLPVIMVTAVVRSPRGARHAIDDLRANAYLMKPVDPDELLRQVRSVLPAA